MYMISESQNEMVHLFAQEVKKKIKEEINSAAFSLCLLIQPQIPQIKIS